VIKDLTAGKPGSVLWSFSIPMLISVMFQQIYNIADSMIAGKFVGEDALAAVGASYPITMIFMAIAMGSNVGCSVVISQFFGGRKYREMKTAVTTTFIASFTLSAVLTVLGLIFCHPMMELIQTPENIFQDAALYLKIYIGGLIFLFLYNICTGMFNALGDSKTPLYFLIGSSVGNIILDLVFVICFHMGVAGVAWATFLAQGISSILSIVTLQKRLREIKTEKKPNVFSWNMLGKIGYVAVPSILQQSFISVGNMFIQGLVNSFGSATIAGYSAAVKLNTFAITSVTTLSNGLSSFTAQNMGAGKVERVKLGFRSGLVMVEAVSVPFFAAYFFLNDYMLRLFMNEGSEMAMGIGTEFLRIVAPFYFVVAVKLIIDGVLRGSGAMKFFMIDTFTDLILRVLIAFVLAEKLGSAGIWLSWPIGWALATGLAVLFYGKGVWKDMGRI
jgi:putative MATE family efflux protein